jgi:hypothetical protein
MDRFYVRNFVLTIMHILIKFCSGGKGNAPTFLTDESFGLALTAILKKDKKKIQVTVEFDTDMMLGYRIQHQVCFLLPHVFLYLHCHIGPIIESTYE